MDKTIFPAWAFPQQKAIFEAWEHHIVEMRAGNGVPMRSHPFNPLIKATVKCRRRRRGGLSLWLGFVSSRVKLLSH